MFDKLPIPQVVDKPKSLVSELFTQLVSKIKEQSEGLLTGYVVGVQSSLGTESTSFYLLAPYLLFQHKLFEATYPNSGTPIQLVTIGLEQSPGEGHWTENIQTETELEKAVLESMEQPAIQELLYKLLSESKKKLNA